MTTERWALVPVEATILQRLEMAKADDESSDRYRKMSAAMIQASPGAALLAEVLAARDAFPGDPKGWDKRLVRLLAALDKLGPAAEGAT